MKKRDRSARRGMSGCRYLAMFCGLSGIIHQGCAVSPLPEHYPVLDQSRTLLESVREEDEVVRFSPQELDRAEMTLADAELALRDRGDLAEVERLASLAGSYVHVAVEQTAIRKAEQEIIRLEQQARQAQFEHRLGEMEKELAGLRKRLAASKQDLKKEVERRSGLEEELNLEDKERVKLENTLRLEVEMSDLLSGKKKGGMLVTLGNDSFDVGQAGLKPEAVAIIDRLASFLNGSLLRKVQVLGFAAAVPGSETDSLNLVIKRAGAIRDALSSRSVALERIQIQGYENSSESAAKMVPVEDRTTGGRVAVVISDENGVMPKAQD